MSQKAAHVVPELLVVFGDLYALHVRAVFRVDHAVIEIDHVVFAVVSEDFLNVAQQVPPDSSGGFLLV